MALRYLTTLSALMTMILAKDTNDPSPLKDANLLLAPGLLPARPLLGQRNNPFDLLLFKVSGRLLRHANSQKGLCGGSALHSACPSDVTKCCPTGGDSCGDGVCESGYVCQRNHLEKAVCCPKGHDCSVVLPVNPCVITTYTKCAGFDACCPPSKTCQLVGGDVSCVDTPSGGSGNALAKRAESSVPPVSGGPGSGPVPCTTCSTAQVSSLLQVSSSSVRPPSSTPAQPPSSSAPAQPPSSSSPAQPPSSSAPAQPPSSNAPTRPPSSSAPVQPPSSSVAPPSPTTRPPSVTTPAPSVTTKPPSVTTKPPSVTTKPPSVTTKPPSSTEKPPTQTATGSERIVTLGNTPPSPSTIIKTQSPSVPDRDPSSFVQTISQTRSKEASTLTRDGTVITQAPTVVSGSSGTGSKSAARTTTVETSISTSAVVSDGITSYVDIPIVTTRVVAGDFVGTETDPAQTTKTGGSTGKSSPNPAVIAGASIGGTVLLAAVVFGIFLLMRKKRAQRKKGPDMQGIFTPPPVREPTIPVLPLPPSSGAGGRGSTASPVSELSSRGVVAPVPRYASIHVPSGVAELQEEEAAAAREGNPNSEYYPTNIPYELQTNEQQQQMQQVHNGYPVHAQPGLHEVYGNPPPGSPPPPPHQHYGQPQQQQYMAYPGGNSGGYTRGGY